MNIASDRGLPDAATRSLDLAPGIGLWRIANGYMVGKRNPKSRILRIDKHFVYFETYEDALDFQMTGKYKDDYDI